MKALYKMSLNCGRQGSIDSLFLATPEQVKNLLGKEVTFDEPFGKYSEITWKFEKGDITLVSDSPLVVNIMEEYSLEQGPNPVEMVEDEAL